MFLVIFLLFWFMELLRKFLFSLLNIGINWFFNISKYGKSLFVFVDFVIIIVG